jgi:preprotein translocase subunit SecE
MDTDMEERLAETLITTGLVFAMAAVTAIFFFVVDQIIGVGVRTLFGLSV